MNRPTPAAARGGFKPKSDSLICPEPSTQMPHSRGVILTIGATALVRSRIVSKPPDVVLAGRFRCDRRGVKRNLRELRRNHSTLDGGLFNVLNLVRLDPIVNTPGASRFDDKLHIRPLGLHAVEAQSAVEAVEYERVFSALPQFALEYFKRKSASLRRLDIIRGCLNVGGVGRWGEGYAGQKQKGRRNGEVLH
jgi:hypothetical protein